MLDIGVYHPQIVHFVVALLVVGVAARVVSLLPLGGRISFVGPMAATLILLGTLGALAAVHSGLNAHGPVERVPGAREAVVEHEEWGERTRNVFLVVALLEIAMLAMAGRRRLVIGLRVVSAVAGLGGLAVLYEASEHGGALVYGHAGGVGIRSGDPADVKRLLVAGLYHNARVARDSGHKEEAARFTEELARQMPADMGVRLLAIESMIEDRDDPRAALVTLAGSEFPANDVRLQVRKGMLVAEAYQALGAADSAQSVIAELKGRYRDDPRVQAMLERMAQRQGEGR